jgi:RNA polymerase sigma-70 factor (ECF subfamily)
MTHEAVLDASSAAQAGTPSPDEEALVAAVVRKDRKATAEFVERFADPVHAYVRHRLAPRADLVEDLVQDVFLAALKGLPSFAGRSSLKTWLIGIARHKVEDFYRAQLRRAETPSDLDDDSGVIPLKMPELDEEMDDAKRRAKTRRVLSRLPGPYGYALIWRYWENRSVKAIATETGRTEKAGERLLARARTQFKRLWEAD